MYILNGYYLFYCNVYIKWLYLRSILRCNEISLFLQGHTECNILKGTPIQIVHYLIGIQ